MTCAQILKRPEFESFGQQVDWEMRNNQVPWELPILLPEAAWNALPDAVSELVYAVRSARNALDHLHQALSDSAASDPGLIGLIELSSRGLRHVAENEGELLDDVEFVIREAVSRLAEHKVNTKSKERKS
ncbi:MAG: hypothetical protein ACK5II_01710 [Paracoccus sp. (in: a-proteobacteria)]